MNGLKRGSVMRKRVFRSLCTVTMQFLLSAAVLRAEEPKIFSGKFVVEPPTLTSLGFEWYVAGDDNRNAVVSVRYRKRGEVDWRDALPLLRLQREELINNYGAYDLSTSAFRPVRIAAPMQT